MKDDLPAFPSHNTLEDLGGRMEFGMTLRDYFAAKALQGLLVQEYYQNAAFNVVVKEAYGFADAMMEARK